MEDLMKRIEQADECEVEMLLEAVLARYAEVFPGWEVSTISLHRSTDRNEQIDRMIGVLQRMKTAVSE